VLELGSGDAVLELGRSENEQGARPDGRRCDCAKEQGPQQRRREGAGVARAGGVARSSWGPRGEVGLPAWRDAAGGVAVGSGRRRGEIRLAATRQGWRCERVKTSRRRRVGASYRPVGKWSGRGDLGVFLL